MSERLRVFHFEYGPGFFVAERARDGATIRICMDSAHHTHSIATLSRLVDLGLVGYKDSVELRKRIRAWMDGETRDFSV